MMGFTKAVRKKARLRLALTGPSGSGKTYGALQIAVGIGGKIAAIDTEKGSASLYAHLTDFDVLELQPPYTPERFIDAVKEAETAGYETLIIDSITHEWSGVGGCLELVDEVAKAKYRGNSWSAWNEITPRHREFLDALLRSNMHVIATMRSKTETAQVEDGNRKKVVKLGMKAEQRDGAEYEFTTVLDIVHDGHYAVASKDRTGLFTDKDAKIITPETGKALLAWLESGEAVTEQPEAPPPGPQGNNAPASAKSVSQATFDAMDEAEQNYLRDIAMEAMGYLYKDDAAGALDFLRSKQLDADEQVAINSLFDSKQRAAMKKAAKPSAEELANTP